MITLLRDYFCLNRNRLRKDFLVVLTGAVLLEIGVFLQSLASFSNMSASMTLIYAVGTVALVASAVFAAHLFLAYSIVWSSAREAGLSLIDYLTSDLYRNEGKNKLKQDSGIKLW